MSNAKDTRGGCWTCRLRRKKCDEARPVCRNCSLLEISCHGSGVKPTWMDGGAKQKEMSERVKAQIKRRGQKRRERGPTTRVEDGQFILESGVYPTSREIEGPRNESASSLNAAFKDSSALSIASGKPTKRATPGQPKAFDRIMWAASELSFLDEVDDQDGAPNTAPLLAHERDFEIDFLVKYLDYVFPLLFPFYQPGIHETGRSWVMALLRRSRVAFHSTMSMAAYFFTFTLINEHPGEHDDCKDQMWAKVSSQTEITFDKIQQDILDLSLRGPKVTLLEKVRVMEGISQFLIFEIAVSRSADWNLHLTPALALFRDIWYSADADSDDLRLLAILDSIAANLRYGLDHGSYVWTPEQAGFRFFTGLLVFLDVIASTSIERCPQLAEYHTNVLAESDSGEPDFGVPSVQLSRLLGCQNWVLVAISQITTLDVWKKEMKSAASLSMIEIVERASFISTTLHTGLDHLDALSQTHEDRRPLSFRSYLYGPAATPSTSATTTTKIWAHAALIYLAVVVSGWQPSNADIRLHVDHTLKLLKTVNVATHLRTLAWPLCTAGCLAEAGDHEQGFRDLFTDVDELNMVGALGEARNIMEQVWARREQLVRETWDLAACFKILGSPALLV
jgi:C6 transcription factor Pro1